MEREWEAFVSDERDRNEILGPLGIPAALRDENAMPEGVRREFVLSGDDVDELPSRRESRPIPELPAEFRSFGSVRSLLPWKYWRPKGRSESGVRPSFSGIQDKVCCVLERSGEGFVLRAPNQGQERGNIILKPAWGSKAPMIGINEAFCMDFSVRSGDVVPRIGLVPYGLDVRFPQAHYFIERFDWEPDSEFVTVNEFLGYETSSRGEIPLPDVLAALAPVLGDSDWDLLMRRLVISFLVGNGDLHLKNLSLRLRADETKKPHSEISVSLSPSYDVVSTAVLGDRELFALPLGFGYGSFPLGERNRRAFEQFLGLMEQYADISAISKTAESAKRNAKKSMNVVLNACLRDGYPNRYVRTVRAHLERIADTVEKRAAALQRAV